MTETIIPFQEALSIANKYQDNEKNLLLGNGFSIDCDSEIFDYKALFHNADFSEDVRKIFEEFNTMDFEKIIGKFIESSRLLTHYNDNIELSKKLKNEANIIKGQLVEVISNRHPDTQSEVGENKFYSALRFLSYFKNIFTLNYDLLLYWTLMHKSDFERISKTDFDIFQQFDGFRKGIWAEEYAEEINKEQNVFYMHGALHLFDVDTYIRKIQRNVSNSLKTLIETHLENDNFPLIVAEGNSSEKLAKIKHNEYLRYCLESLKGIKGCIFIHGHSLDANDKHILNTIKGNSNIKQLFISVFNPAENFDTIYEKIGSNFGTRITGNTLKVYFYDSASAGIWDGHNGKS